jgi:hypothetical protein
VVVAALDYELSINSDTAVQAIENDASIRSGKFDFVPIEAVAKFEPDSNIDIIGVCVGTAHRCDALRSRFRTCTDGEY